LNFSIVPHLVEDFFKSFQVLERRNSDVEELLDLIKDVVVCFLIDQGQSDAISAKSASSSDTVEVVGEVW